MRDVRQFEVLVSCPSDVTGEPEIVKRVFERFNSTVGTIIDVNLQQVHWKKDAYPQSGGAPQSLLNKQIVDRSDAVIAILWTRFGTPTDKYGSGTEEEIERTLQSGKQVFLYFSDVPIHPSRLDETEHKKVKAFREKCKARGIYSTYATCEEFEQSLFVHLFAYFKQMPFPERHPHKTEVTQAEITKTKIPRIWTDDQRNLVAELISTAQAHWIYPKDEEAAHINLLRIERQIELMLDRHDSNHIALKRGLERLIEVVLRRKEERTLFDFTDALSKATALAQSVFSTNGKEQRITSEKATPGSTNENSIVATALSTECGQDLVINFNKFPSSTGELHRYSLTIRFTNNSTQKQSGYLLELFFPFDIPIESKESQAEQPEIINGLPYRKISIKSEGTIFRDEVVQIADEQRNPITYSMNNNLYWMAIDGRFLWKFYLGSLPVITGEKPWGKMHSF